VSKFITLWIRAFSSLILIHSLPTRDNFLVSHWLSYEDQGNDKPDSNDINFSNYSLYHSNIWQGHGMLDSYHLTHLFIFCYGHNIHNHWPFIYLLLTGTWLIIYNLSWSQSLPFSIQKCIMSQWHDSSSCSYLSSVESLSSFGMSLIIISRSCKKRLIIWNVKDLLWR